MDPRKIALACFILLFSFSSFSYEFKSASEKTLFKNYALSSCVASNYEDETIFQDAIDALNGNREYGNIALEAYHEINDALEKWSKKEYVSKAGNVSEFSMCIDFQNSEDILDIFNKYNPCLDRKSWSSKKEYKLRCKKG